MSRPKPFLWTLHKFYDDDCADLELVSEDGIVFRASLSRLRRRSGFFDDLPTLNPAKKLPSGDKTREIVPLDVSAAAVRAYLDFARQRVNPVLPPMGRTKLEIELYHLGRFVDCKALLMQLHVFFEEGHTREVEILELAPSTRMMSI